MRLPLMKLPQMRFPQLHPPRRSVRRSLLMAFLFWPLAVLGIVIELTLLPQILGSRRFPGNGRRRAQTRRNHAKCAFWRRDAKKRTHMRHGEAPEIPETTRNPFRTGNPTGETT